MGAKAMLACMVAGTAAVILLAPRRSEPARQALPARPPEVPWLSKEAAAQLVADDGNLGPLFRGVVLGGPPPADETRAHIAEFAQANRVTIDLDVEDEELVAVRLDVTFHGGVGYEGADVFALRLGRTSTGSCCVCPVPDTWIDDWTTILPEGAYFHGVVRVNRVLARWERPLSLPELVERADSMLGQRADKIRTVPPLSVRIEDDHVVEVSLRVQELDDDTRHSLASALKHTYGRPRTRVEGLASWERADRTIEASDDRVTISRR